MTHDPKIDERADLEALLSEWMAAGHVPQLVQGCRQENTSMKVIGPQGRAEYQWQLSDGQ